MDKGSVDGNAAARVIAAQVRLAEGYLTDSKLLAAHTSRNAVNLLFQAVEAALIAVMTSEGLHAGRATQHQLGPMTEALPDKNPLKRLFGELEHLTAYATTYRYASAYGRVKPGPDARDLSDWQSRAGRIVTACAEHFRIDLSPGTMVPAGRVTPPRQADDQLANGGTTEGGT